MIVAQAGGTPAEAPGNPFETGALRAAVTAGRADQAGVSQLSGREDLFLEGDDATHVFEVVEGVVCMYRIMPDGSRHVLAFRFPGEIVGLCSPGTYGYNAQAVGDTRVRRIPLSGLERLIDERSDFARKLLRMATAELNAMREHLKCLASKSAEAKVADFLLMLARRRKTERREAVVVNLPMTRTDIGDYLGLTIETVSRTISKFRRMGVIDLPHTNQIVVRQLDRLAELAGAA